MRSAWTQAVFAFSLLPTRQFAHPWEFHMADPFYITTAIDYTNAPPHIGHAYEKILADVLARFHRLKGDDVYFLTGVDQHGQKVQQSAAKGGVEPQAFVDALSEKFIALWKRLEVGYDAWAATTDPTHKRCVQDILQALYDSGKIYRAPYKGFYSERQEQFLTDKERGPDGQFGPEWGNVVELEETNWYFKLGEYKAWLVDFIEKTPGLVYPEYRQRELLNAAKKLEGDLSISRPKSRLTWGIEIPFDRECVTFVWFDALVNYISFAGYRQAATTEGALAPEFQPPATGAQWPALHVIGKDILVPAHGIYWLCMLKAMGFTDAQMPRLLVHGYVNIAGEKMSKSLGNILDPNAVADSIAAGIRRGYEKQNERAAGKGKPTVPEETIAAFAERCGPEALRYYLMRDCSVGGDMDFTDERLLGRYETDLGNVLGNLLNRTLNMALKQRGGKLVHQASPAGPSHTEHLAAYGAAMHEHRIQQAIESAIAIAITCNQFIETEKPFSLAKDPAQADRLNAVLYYLLESIRIVAILMSPVLPRASAAILSQLGWAKEPRLADTAWGGLPDEHQLGNPTPVFPGIEVGAKP
jgi:methionyl-tRNA synthetase